MGITTEAKPLTWAQVLREEYTGLRPQAAWPGGAGDAADAAALYGAAHRLQQPLCGLCLSGGGIRSATFGLGVLQGLAGRGAWGEGGIERLDYLSTVSGGGYIGAWLSARMHREGRRRAWNALRPSQGRAALEHLRAFSRYLTPRAGAAALDTWALIATVLGNLLWTWMVFLPLLLAAVLAPRLVWMVARPWGVDAAEVAWAPAAALAAAFIVLTLVRCGRWGRERWARCGGALLLAAALWLGVSALTVAIPAWLLTLAGVGRRSTAALAAAVAASAASVGGWLGARAGSRAPSTPAQPRPARHAGEALLVRAAPALFVAGLVVALAAVMLARLPLAVTAPAMAVLLALALGAGRVINVNACSLQGLYRDRLVRAYLDGSDFPLSHLAQQHPLPVMNMTLNLTADPRLSWQQRRAALFTATPLHCGSAVTGWRPAAAYVGGLSLGTAMATSGAAVSPNRGCHSSPPVALLMTLFNFRLGIWLGNPARSCWRRSGPRSAVRWLAQEALGWSGPRSAYVNLSDGGHFENLGLYALVQRRCRRILAVDADCDPALACADLGNAVEKIRVDFGVPIEFEAGELEALRARRRRWARARIRYAAADGADAPDGELIYVKPMVRGDEAADVLSYARAHAAFPHESTLEQWFDETQMESYRMLGLETARSLPATHLFGRVAAEGPAAQARRYEDETSAVGAGGGGGPAAGRLRGAALPGVCGAGGVGGEAGGAHGWRRGRITPGRIRSERAAGAGGNAAGGGSGHALGPESGECGGAADAAGDGRGHRPSHRGAPPLPQ